jgi:short-subunit dehydrogenase
VILAGRNPVKGRAAIPQILARNRNAKVEFGMIDLADLRSVAEFADSLVANGQPIDNLINNAGVMTPPSYCATADGFEL